MLKFVTEGSQNYKIPSSAYPSNVTQKKFFYFSYNNKISEKNYINN